MEIKQSATKGNCALEITDHMIKVDGGSVSIKSAGNLKVQAPGMFESKIYCFGKELKMYERFVYADAAVAKKFNKRVLKQVAAWLRPFCYVRWEKM